MQKRRVYSILGIVAVVLAGVLVAVLSREREPEYGGKRLSSWIKQVGRAASPGSDEEAANALRQIGTNALPYLLKWMRYEPSSLKTTMYGAANFVLENLNPEWGLNDAQTARADEVVYCFPLLGTETEQAIPELCRLLNLPKPCHPSRRASIALTYLGAPILLAVLTNHQSAAVTKVQVASLLAFGSLETNGPILITAVKQLLVDPQPEVREAATNIFRVIDPVSLERATR